MRLTNVALAVVFTVLPAGAQEPLDRVLARVDGHPVTLSDTRAAIGLGIVEVPPGVDPTLAAMRQLVERRLVLAEVARFAPPEPDPSAVAAEVRALEARAGTPAQLAILEKTTGFGEPQIRDIARDNLRIEAYLEGRFGSSVQVSDEEVGQYYRTHLDEFREGGEVMPFVRAEPAAREKAAAQRRQAIIFQWMRELRARADVVELYLR